MTAGSDAPAKAKNVKHPHDRVVRKVLADPGYIAAEAATVLPAEVVAELSGRWGLDALIAAPTAFITETLGDNSCDLLYYSTVEDQTVYYILLEHQSSNDYWMALRVAVYTVGIWQRHRQDHPLDRYLPYVIPLVIHQGPQPWTAPRDLGELLFPDERLAAALGGVGPAVSVCRGRSGAGGHRRVAGPSGAAGLGVVVGGCSRRCRAARTCWRSCGPGFRICARWPLMRIGGGELGAMLAYIRNWANIDETPWQEFLHTLGPEVEKVYMTLAEQAEIRCLAQGRTEGIVQGRTEGAAATLLRQMERKFGPVDAGTRERVLSASQAELDVWTDEILTATSCGSYLADTDVAGPSGPRSSNRVASSGRSLGWPTLAMGADLSTTARFEED